MSWEGFGAEYDSWEPRGTHSRFKAPSALFDNSAHLPAWCRPGLRLLLRTPERRPSEQPRIGAVWAQQAASPKLSQGSGVSTLAGPHALKLSTS